MSDIVEIPALRRIRERAARLRRITGDPRGRLTPSQRELQQFIPAAEQEVEQERSRIRPLQFIFDLLSRGQYFAANIAEEIKQSWQTGEPLGQAAEDAVRAAWEGITGKRKGTFEEVFFGHIPKEERNFGQKLVGFAADVLLDPLTFVSLGTLTGFRGATAGARAAAARFALDSVRLTTKEIGPEVAERLGSKALQEAPELLRGLQKLTRADPLKRELTDVFNQSYRRALLAPRGVTGEQFQRGLQRELAGRFRAIPTPTQRIAPGVILREALPPAEQQAMDALRRSIAEGYGAAGERAFNFFGLQFHKGVRPPSVAARAFESLRQAFHKTVPGQRFGDAWWAIMNGGPVDAVRAFLGRPTKGFGMVGALRKAFGFLDDPLQKTLKMQSRVWDEGYHTVAHDGISRGLQATAKLTDEQKELVVDAINAAHVQSTPELALSARDILLRQGMGDEAVLKAADDVQEIFRRMRADELPLIDQGIITSINNDLNYLPKLGKEPLAGLARGREIGSFKPRVAERATATFGEHVGRNKERLRAVIGDDMLQKAADEGGRTVDDILNDLVRNKGFGDISMGLDEMIAVRSIIHARILKRGNIVSSFREMGIPKRMVPQALANGSVELGLHPVADEALKDFLFDSDVAQIINRTFDLTKTNEGINAVKKFWFGMTRLWKGFATATPRFHARNFISNNMTGFLKHGLKWMNPDRHLDAMVATYYGLHKGNLVDLMTDHLNLPRNQVEKIVQGRLNKRVGNRTLREWADEARDRGVITRRTFTREDIIAGTAEEFGGATKENILFRISHAVGDGIENQARMQSFLIDVADGAGARGIADYATMEAKKWFLDYGALTDFEKRILRPIIPFYSWIRKNLANQISGLVLHGDLYTVIPKAQRFAQRLAGVNDEDFDYQLLEDWQQNLALFPMWVDGANKKAVLAEAPFAYQDINKLPFFFEEGRLLPRFERLEDTLSEVISASHPAIQTIAELGFGRDIFRRRDIKDLEIAPGVLQRVIPFLDGAMRMAGFEEGFPAMQLDEGGRVVIPGPLKQILENNIPLLRSLESVFEGVETAVEVASEGFDDVIKEVSEENEYGSAVQRLFRSMAFWLGPKFRTFDIEERERERAEDVRARAEKARREFRRGLPGFEQRSATASRRRLEELQKLGLL